MTRLLYIIPFIDGAGGLQRILALKTNYLIENWNYEIHILVTNSEIANQYFDFNPKVYIHYRKKTDGLFFKYLYSYSQVLKREIKLINPDVIIVCDNGFKGYSASLLLPKKHKIIFECHVTKFISVKKTNLFEAILNKFKYIYYDYCISKYTKCIVLVEEMKNEFNSKNTAIITNPLWFSNDKIAIKNSKKVIAVGRHTYQKGFDNMLKIWKKVVEKHSDWILEIYGESTDEIDLRSLSKKLEIENNIVFYEPTTNIIEKYLDASFLILTSRQEGFGMVLIEAMANGLPCVAFDCPCGPKDIITNNKDGFLVKNGDETAFETAICSLIENQTLRDMMGKNAKIASENYNIDAIMSTWNELFLSLN